MSRSQAQVVVLDLLKNLTQLTLGGHTTSVQNLFLDSFFGFKCSSLLFLWGNRSYYQQLHGQQLCLQNLFMSVPQRIGKGCSFSTLCPIPRRSPVTRLDTSVDLCRMARFRITGENVAPDPLYPRPFGQAESMNNLHVQAAFWTSTNIPVQCRSQTD